jgi:hypothetical protein
LNTRRKQENTTKPAADNNSIFINYNQKDPKNFKLGKLRKMKSGQMSTMGSYLNRIETTEEVSVARFIRTILSLSVYNFFLKPQTVKGLDVTGTASQASKRSILMNQNHMYYQLNMYSQKDAIGSFTSRTNESRNDEYLSMRK